MLWKLEPEGTRDDLIFAIEDWNEEAQEKQFVTEIKAYDRETDSMRTLWRRHSQRIEAGPRVNTVLEALKYYDMHLKIPNYTFTDYIPFLEHCFNQALARLAEAGWSSIKAPVLHQPNTEPHGHQSREWIRAEFPDANLA